MAGMIKVTASQKEGKEVLSCRPWNWMMSYSYTVCTRYIRARLVELTKAFAVRDNGFRASALSSNLLLMSLPKS